MKLNLSFLFVVAIFFTQAQVPSAGLLGYYPFIGNANDVSGNAQNGSVNGAVLTTDRFGNANNAYHFNGVSDYISLPTTSYVGLNNYSYSVWIRAFISSNNGRIICIGENGGLVQSLSYQTAGYLFASSFNVGTSPSLSYSQSGTIPNNAWLHVVVTRDASDIMMYINGMLVSSATPSNTNSQANYGTVTPYRAFIGARTTLASTFFFEGELDDVRFYNRVLSSAEVVEIYKEPDCNQALTLNASPGLNICAGTSVSLTAVGAGSNVLSWYNSVSSTSSINTGTLYSTPNLAATNGNSIYPYYVEVNSCTVVPRASLSITVNALPNLSINTSNSLICIGESSTLAASGATSYSWMPNANTFSVVPSVVVSPTINTTYTLTGMDGNTCVNKITYTQMVSHCTGLSLSAQSQLGFHLYPNPVKDILQVRSAAGLKNVSLDVYNYRAQLIKTIRAEGCDFMLDFSELETGIYFVRFYQDGLFMHQQKVIKE